MKKIIFLFSITILSLTAMAQSIGIGTTTPASSAALDISSTAKGLLVPRMSTSQRMAIAAPVNGLMVYDNTTNGFWFYNGGAWVSMSGSATLSLPYYSPVNVADTAFHIKNSGSVAIAGEATGATGVSGISSSNNGVEGSSINGSGVYGNSFSGQGINAYSFNGNGVMANSTNGSAVYGFTNNANATIYGSNSNGLGVGVQGNSSLHNGVLGTSAGTSKAGVRGEATGNGGVGIYGTTSSSTGYGVYGSNLTGIAVYGFSNTGTGVRALSNSGLALEVIGNLKISGGNTTPIDGGVLTSDASGNANWQKTKVAFMATGINTNYRTFGEDFNFRVHWDQEEYDYDNNYLLHVGTNPVSSSSTFTVPVTGLYHFITQIAAGTADNSTAIQYGSVIIKALRNGVLIKSYSSDLVNDPDSPEYATGVLTADMKLQAGDMVFVEVRIHTGGVSGLLYIPGSAFFGGHLVFAD